MNAPAQAASSTIETADSTGIETTGTETSEGSIGPGFEVPEDGAADGGAVTVGFRAPQVCRVVGITYRQLDYWDRTELLKPSLSAARGSGTQRLYSFGDIVQLKVVKRLLDAGMSLKRIRAALSILAEQVAGHRPLADITLLSDGQTIYAARNPDEVVDVFRRGQGVFGIAVGPVQAEVEGAILDLDRSGESARADGR